MTFTKWVAARESGNRLETSDVLLSSHSLGGRALLWSSFLSLDLERRSSSWGCPQGALQVYGTWSPTRPSPTPWAVSRLTPGPASVPQESPADSDPSLERARPQGGSVLTTPPVPW